MKTSVICLLIKWIKIILIIGKGRWIGAIFEAYKLHIWFHPQTTFSRTFPGGGSADSVACEKNRREWVVVAVSWLHSSPFHLCKQSQSHPYQGNHCPCHLFESRRGKWGPTWVRWGCGEKWLCLRHVLKQDSTGKWEASKESLELKPPSFFSIFSMLWLLFSGLIKICPQERIWDQLP